MPWVFIALFFGVGGLSILLNLVLKGIVVPIRLRNRVSIVGKPEYRPTTMEELTPEMQQFVGSLIHKFQAIGFEPAANLSNPGTVPGVSCVFILLVNRKTGDMATLTMTSAENIRALVFAITSTFPDETEIVSGVNPSVGTGSKDKRQDVAIFSWVREPAVLLEAHARRLSRAGRQDEPRIFPSPGEEIAFIENDWARNIARSVERDERYFDPKTGKYWSRLQPLLIGKDAAALAETRSALMRALGIASAQVPAAAAPVAIAL
jgi:hypothetical protein